MKYDKEFFLQVNNQGPNINIPNTLPIIISVLYFTIIKPLENKKIKTKNKNTMEERKALHRVPPLHHPQSLFLR